MNIDLLVASEFTCNICNVTKQEECYWIPSAIMGEGIHVCDSCSAAIHNKVDISQLNAVDTKMINLFGGPGIGKSRTASRIFAELKDRGFNVEIVTEAAKEFTWEKRPTALSNQLHITGEQTHREHRLHGKVDYIITDSPTILGAMYADKDSGFYSEYCQLIVAHFNTKSNINIVLERDCVYNPKGRNQTEEEAGALDGTIESFLNAQDICYFKLSNKDTNALVDHILNQE